MEGKEEDVSTEMEALARVTGYVAARFECQV
jgi:hypothetical protein